MVKKLLKWLKDNAVEFALGLLFLAGAFVGYRALRSRRDKVTGGQHFIPSAEGDGFIDVQTPDGWRKVQLPKGVKYNEVTAVSVKPGSAVAKVEVKHEKTDFRNPGDPIDGNIVDRGL